MKLTKVTLLCLFILPFAFLTGYLQSEQPEFRLDVNRDFGFGNGADVRGNFSLKIYGDQTLIRAVTFIMDGKEMGKVNQPPFVFKFVTSNYPDGRHDLTALIETTDGRRITPPAVSLNFISAAVQSQFMTRIFIFAFILIIVLGGIGVATQIFSLRGAATRPPGYKRNYSSLGGTICPRCSRPFPIHIWSLSLVIGRFDRCDNCGKWSLVHRYAPEVLQASEQAEIDAFQNAGSASASEEDDEQQLRKKLEESKYIDQ